jgi:hypothetical protein
VQRGLIESVIGIVLRNYDGHGSFSQVCNVKGSLTGTVPDSRALTWIVRRKGSIHLTNSRTHQFTNSPIARAKVDACCDLAVR